MTCIVFKLPFFFFFAPFGESFEENFIVGMIPTKEKKKKHFK